MAEPNFLAKALRQGAGALETGATFGSSLLGSVPAGYMGLIELLRSGDTSKAADKVAQTQSALTYQPRTNAGQTQTKALGEIMSYSAKPAEWIGEQTLNATGSPMAATAANMVLDPLNYIGPGLLGKGMKGAANAAPRLLENAMIPSQYNKQMGAIVWHASPYKFDKFDSNKIGTGEGAQAYGHGLYTAEANQVAQEYFDRFSNPAFKYKDQVEASARIKRKIADRVEQSDPERAAALRQEADKVTGEAHMYKIDLPDDQIAKMLDWDKPLSEQPKEVQKAYKAYLKTQEASDLAKDWSRYQEGMRLDQAEPMLSIKGDPSGNNIYRNAFKDVNAANQFLMQQGIPGIRYLDGGSRGTGAGTSNFVVFPGNEGLLKILERNGQKLE